MPVSNPGWQPSEDRARGDQKRVSAKLSSLGTVFQARFSQKMAWYVLGQTKGPSVGHFLMQFCRTKTTGYARAWRLP